jgi:hypothetical protein
LTVPWSHPPKLRLLRVFGVAVEAFLYCVRSARRLFIISWFPCAFISLSDVLLEWLILAWPPRMPAWALSNSFHPPTWLTALTTAFWSAMVWALVLDEMRRGCSGRGVIRGPSFQLSWIRFELGLPVLLAAAILSVVYLAEGLARFAQLQILMQIYTRYEPSDSMLASWNAMISAVRLALVAGLTTLCSPIVAQIVAPERINLPRLSSILRGNWFRLALVFLFVHIVLLGLDELLAPLTRWLLQPFAHPMGWTLREALLRSVLEFPLQLLWVVIWPVIIGVVLNALDKSPMEDSGGTLPAN